MFPIVRTITGGTPTSGSRLAVAALPCNRSGLPPPTSVISETRQAAMSSNPRVRRCQSTRVAGETRFFGVPNAEKSSQIIARRFGGGRMVAWTS